MGRDPVAALFPSRQLQPDSVARGNCRFLRFALESWLIWQCPSGPRTSEGGDHACLNQDKGLRQRRLSTGVGTHLSADPGLSRPPLAELGRENEPTRLGSRDVCSSFPSAFSAFSALPEGPGLVCLRRYSALICSARRARKDWYRRGGQLRTTACCKPLLRSC